MAVFLVATKTQLQTIRAAVASAEGLPRRGAVYLDSAPRPDLDLLPQTYSAGAAGWTDQLIETPIEGDAQAVIEVPAALAKYLGKKLGAVTLPAAGKLLAELPADLVAAVRARRGSKADGSPFDGSP